MNFFEKALEIASRLTLPIPVVAFAIVLSAFAFAAATKSSRRKASSLLLLALIAIVVLGLAPLAASTYLQSRGVYRIEVVVRGNDKRIIRDAEVSTSTGSELKKGEGYWEIVIPAKTRPQDRRVQIFASEDAQSGDSTVTLGDSFYIQAAIDLGPPSPTSIRGMVRDASGAGTSDAHVFIQGCKDGATTDRWGSFEIPAYFPEGQMVTVRAEKDGRAAQETIPAGATADLTLEKVQ